MLSRSHSTGKLFLLISNRPKVTSNEPFAPSFQVLFSTHIVGEKPIPKDGHCSDYSNYLDAKLLERIDHYCSGWLKLQKDKSSMQGKKGRTITFDTSFMEEFGLLSKTRTKDGYNPLLDDFKNTKFYLSVPTHNIK